MTPDTSRHVALPQFSTDEWRRLRALRQRYTVGYELFTPRERAHLGFMRWLCHSRHWDQAADCLAGAYESSHIKGAGIPAVNLTGTRRLVQSGG